MKFPVSDVKWVTIYEIYYQKTGVELFFFSNALSYLLEFDTPKRAEKVYKKMK